MFNYSLSIKKLPTLIQTAALTLIPKQDKDLEDPSSYRPISLQSIENKILAKSLAKRLEPV